MSHGGARPNSGRKAKNPDLLNNPRKTEQELQARRDAMPNFEKFPDMPDDMLDGEIIVWEEIMTEYKEFFEATGIMPINSLDKKALQNYCMYFNILTTLRKELKLNSSAFVTKTHRTKAVSNDDRSRVSEMSKKEINPIFHEIIKIETRLSGLAMQLNLTPDARARMGIAIAKNKKDELGAFMDEL